MSATSRLADLDGSRLLAITEDQTVHLAAPETDGPACDSDEPVAVMAAGSARRAGYVDADVATVCERDACFGGGASDG